MNTVVVRIILTLLFGTLGLQSCFADDAVAPMQAIPYTSPPLVSKPALINQMITR